MNIQLSDAFRLEKSTDCVVLVQRIKTQNLDKETRKPTGQIGYREKKTFHFSIEQACCRAFEKMLEQPENSETAEALAEAIIQAKEEIIQAVRTVLGQKDNK